MALNILRSLGRFPRRKLRLISARPISTTSVRKIVEIEEKMKDNVISVSGKPAMSDRASRLACAPTDRKACPLCQLGLTVTYSDVLILEQFMRSDGTVLPPDVTGLCEDQQTKVERCVQQAHWSGLFPSHKPKGYEAKTEEVGYKLFKRHWVKPDDMFERKIDLRVGTWYYIRRY